MLNFICRSIRLFLAALCLETAGVTLAQGDATASAKSKNAEPLAESIDISYKVTHKVAIKTSMGDVLIGLYGEDAPLSVNNFIAYAKDGFYDGTIFHRVIDGFMIQGGGFNESYTQKATKAAIKNEADNGLKNLAGTLAMARTQVVNSATSQFFINVVDNDFLNYRNSTPRGYGYAVFGKVLEGMDVVEKIKIAPIKPRGAHANAPAETIKIISAIVQE